MKTIKMTCVALLLAGCWGDKDKKAFVDHCVGMGAGDKGFCSCQFDFMKAELDPETFGIVMAGARGEQEKAAQLKSEAGYDGLFGTGALAVVLMDFESKTKKQCGS